METWTGCGASCGTASRFNGCPGVRTRPRWLAFDEAVPNTFEVYDTPEGYIIYFDATGFRRDDFAVSVKDGRLHVRASRESGIVERSWELPEDVYQDGVSAKLDTNELTVLLPKLPVKSKLQFDVPIECEQASSPPPAQPAAGQSSTSAAAEAPIAKTEPVADLAASKGKDDDGSWIDVADEDVAKAKAKGKAPMKGPVMQDSVEGQAGSDSE